MTQCSETLSLDSQGISNRSIDLKVESSNILKSSFLKHDERCERGCQLPQVMTDDELINQLFPEH